MTDNLSLVIELRTAEARLAAAMKIALRPLRLTLPQALLLMDLRADGAKSQNAAGRAIGMGHATTKDLVLRLVRRRLVVRRPHPTDGRRLLVDLTATGVRAASKARVTLDAWADGAFASVPQQQRRALKRLVERINDVVGVAA